MATMELKAAGDLEQQHDLPWWRHPLSISTAITFVSGVTALVLDRQGLWPSVMWTMFAIAYVAGGWYSTRKGFLALREGQIDVDLLMVLAAAGAALLGYWHEGAILLFLFALSNTLQEFALDRTRQAVKALMSLHPDEALLLVDGQAEWVPTAALRVGDVVVVRPGDRVPIDGRVVNGESWVDEAAVTGEAAPVHKTAGSEVFAGTINQQGVLEVRVEKTADDTLLARIVRLVEQAREQKATSQERIEWFEQQYAKAVIVIAVVAAVVPLLWGEAPRDAIYRALTLMVVASPCAVAIAAPSAFLAALSTAARRGVLIKGGRYLERLADVDTIAFDKTGTLTIGQMRVSAVIPVPGRTVEEVLATAAAVEAHAEHPLAQAVLAEAERRGIAVEPAEQVEALTGRGIAGTIAGRRFLVGRPELFAAGEAAAWLQTYGERLGGRGQTVVWVGEEQPLGLIAFRDQIKPHMKKTIERLRALGIKRIVMLTGDGPDVAHAVGRQLGIEEVYAALLPQDKVAKIEELTKTGTVAMVGDGINDAPALSRAHVGIGMGAIGSDAALEAADVVLVDDDLRRLPFALALGRRTRRTVLQGLVAAFAVIGGLMIGVLLGRVALPLAVVGHEGSTIVVVLNGLRLLLVRGGDIREQAA